MLSRKLVSLIVVLGLIGSASAALNYEYYEAPEGALYNALADVNFGEAVPVRTGISDTLNSGNGSWIEQAGGHRADDFAFRFIGYIAVPISGDITFYLRSDDGSQIFIDDQLVVDNDGLHGTEGFPGDPGTITLDAGSHAIEVIMFERGGGESGHVAWSAGGQPAVRIPDSVLFVDAPADISSIPASAIVNLKAYNPSPSDGAIELVDADVALLTWSPGYGAVSFDVYISLDAEIDAADLAGTVSDPNYVVTEALVPGATYSWRVDCTDAALNTIEGDVWQISALATEAHFPIPADGDLYRIGVDTQLTWTVGLGGMVHHIYFSEDKALVDARDLSVATMFWPTATFDPGEVVIGTTYYWAVDEFGPAGTFAGPTWSFNAFSFDPVAITDPSLLVHYSFDEIQGGLINDLSGHENYGVVNGNAQLADAAMQFDGATAYVDVPASAWSTIDTQVTLAFWTYIDSATLPQNNFIFGAFSDPANNDARVFNAHLPWGSTIYFDSSGPGYDRTSKAITTAELADAWVHWAFIKNSDTGVVSIYRNGELWQSATDKIKPMNGAGVTKFTLGTKPSLLEGWFKGMMDDVRLYDRALTGQEVLWAMMNMADVTGPDDVVQGVPNEVRDGSIAGWPDGEAPGFAVDNNSGTKFLHFAGEVSPTGIQVAPAAGLTIVTGLTLTTANDSPDRDPISYEVYGSNESIDGPYELIAAGDVNDFAQEAEYPRFTKNATTVAFDNTVAYAFYQVLFPTVRNAATANSMQIAEIELIGEVLPLYFEDFESYAAGDNLEGLGGWAGWGGPAASAPVSDAYAFTGTNSVEIIGSADLVQEFELAGGTFTLSAMQYIPSGTAGTTYFILMNQYGAVNDWSIQTEFHLDTGEIKPWSGAQSAVTIQYDKWVELKYEVDLDANTVVEHYGGVQIDSRVWDDGASGVFGAIDLYGNNASSVYYDNILVD